MEWTDVCISAPRAYAQQIEAIATGISGSGVYIEDYADLEEQVEKIAHVDLIEPELLAKDRNTVKVHFYLPPEQNAAEIAALVRERLADSDVPGVLTLDGVKQEDWETSWKAYYHALPIGSRLMICPSWEEADTPRAVLKLDPGMAFGTGTHETTALCLEQLDALVKGGERVLDVGTGSGILAIAALLLGAQQADGVDIDPVCVRTAAENARLNGVEGRLRLRVGNLSEQAEGVYQIICANIVANAIIALAPDIPALLAPQGIFIASGIIEEREDEVLAALEKAGLSPSQVYHKNGWVCIKALHKGE
ncbi:MAG: 50S ribosomal protein L11 methyltransferase [Oscillospiraceae bacterium]|nr:50S ribosomal protein L11 methyltransferase [Oscillospiraceae bacterium]